MGDNNNADSNLVTTTSLSTGELNMATSEAIKSIHDEMDLLVSRRREIEIYYTVYLATASKQTGGGDVAVHSEKAEF